jgi:multidrug efflux pump subunit AcrB
MIRDILLALLASILLLYFLMAAQFESLTLPLVVLAEIPISLTGSIYFLWLFGSSVNVMSAIGMVVTIGIIINDSIIKIDTIHRMKRTGRPTREAIYTGGLKRLNPIIMTSLTTMLALLPFLWGDDLGRMLQRPLALSLIGGLGVGTLVSLLVIPMFYELTVRKY